MIITTADAPAAIGPYVQGVNLGAMTITSGQLPINPLDGTMPEDIAEQARQSLDRPATGVITGGHARPVATALVPGPVSARSRCPQLRDDLLRLQPRHIRIRPACLRRPARAYAWQLFLRPFHADSFPCIPRILTQMSWASASTE